MSSLKVIKVLLLAMLFLMANSFFTDNVFLTNKAFLKANVFAETIIYLPSDDAAIDPCELKKCDPNGYEIPTENRKVETGVDFNDSFDELKKYDPKAPEFSISKDTSIHELKETLASLRDYFVNIDKDLMKNDKNAMKAQDIILRARAAGDEKAGKVAEEALRKAQGIKAELLKKKELVNSIMQKIQAILAEANRGNYRNFSELCKARREQSERDKNALKRYLEDVERTNKEREERIKERIKEINEELQSFFIDMMDVTLTLIAQSKSLGISEEVKKRLEEYADIIGLMSNIREGVNIHYESQDLKRYEKQLEYVITDQEELAKELQDVKKKSGREKVELGLTSSIDLFLTLAKKNPLVRTLEIIKANSTLVQHSFKIYFLNEEVERDCKVTDEQLKAMNALIEEHKRSFQKVKECKEMMGER